MKKALGLLLAIFPAPVLAGPVSPAHFGALNYIGADRSDSRLPILAIKSNNAFPLGVINDTTSLIAYPQAYFPGAYFGNPAHGALHKMNRLFVGEATTATGDVDASGDTRPASWISAFYPGVMSNAQFASGNALGQLGVMGYSRTSDYHAYVRGASGGSQGVTGFGINDDTTPATTPISCGVCAESVRLANVNGLTVNQFDAANLGAVVDSDPYYGVNSGSTWPLLLTAGVVPAYDASLHHITAMLGFGAGGLAGKIKARVGVISIDGALDPTLGAGGNGVFAMLPRGQSLQWKNSGHTTDAEFYGDGDGLHVKNAALGVDYQVSAAYYVSNSAAPTVKACGASPSVDPNSTNASGSFTTGAGAPSACSIQFANAYPTAAFCTVTPVNDAAAGASVRINASRAGFTVTFGGGARLAQFMYTCSGK